MRFFAVMSLALLAGSVALWVRSVRVNDQLSFRSDRSVFTLMSAPHGVCFQRNDVPHAGAFAFIASSMMLPEPGWSARSLPWGPSVVTSDLGSRGGTSLNIRFTITMNNAWSEPANAVLGFGWENKLRSLVLVVPFWFLVILFSVLPLASIRRALRDRKRHAHGLCPHCGYDLRATPGRCPECGRERSGDFHPPAPRVESAPQ